MRHTAPKKLNYARSIYCSNKSAPRGKKVNYVVFLDISVTGLQFEAFSSKENFTPSVAFVIMCSLVNFFYNSCFFTIIVVL